MSLLDCHAPDASQAIAVEGPSSRNHSVILVGNPNVGKSVLFKNFTNRYVNVSNFPGTTVEIVRSRAAFGDREFDVIDTPGINELSPRSEDAVVTRNIIIEQEDSTIVQVADAKNLRRALLLTFQLAALKRPMLLVLNMVDELEQVGVEIDSEKLSEILGIPVVPTIAIRNEGTETVRQSISEARKPSIEIVEKDEGEEYEHNRHLLDRVNGVLAETYSFHQPRQATLGIRLGFWALHPFKGLLLLGAVLFFVFWFVGMFGAGTLVDGLETAVFQQRLSPFFTRVVDKLLPFAHTHVAETVKYTLSVPLTPMHEVQFLTSAKEILSPAYELGAAHLSFLHGVARFVHDFLVGQYGLITMGLSYALAIVLPIVTTFFLVFSTLEDSGYLPRLAVMVNKLFRIIGLNGKAVLPMVLGLGCDTMATMTTRILETKKERVITTMLLALAVPCSAQLGVLLAMMASVSFAAAAFWVALIILVMIAVGWLTSRVIGGEGSDFILELPPMRRPQFKNVLIKTYTRLEWYLKEVIPLFLIGTAILFFLDKLHLLTWLAQLGEPVVKGWLGLPKETATAFLVGFLRRDFGAVFLLDAATGPGATLSPHQVLVAMVTITLFMPCIANFFMIVKEFGQRIAWSMVAFIFPFAFFVGGLVHHVGLFFTG